jgi:hypothetical protein
LPDRGSQPARKDHAGLLRERAGNADALLLSTGKFVNPAQRLVAKPDAIEAGQCHFDLGARQLK